MGSPRWLGKEENIAELLPSAKRVFLVCCHPSDSSILAPCAKLWIPKIWAGERVHMQSSSRAEVPLCLWEAGVTSSWEQTGEGCKSGRSP